MFASDETAEDTSAATTGVETTVTSDPPSDTPEEKSEKEEPPKPSEPEKAVVEEEKPVVATSTTIHSHHKDEGLDRKIFVGGISWDTTEDDLKVHFGNFGEVASVQIKYDPLTLRSRGFAFVEFSTVEGCHEALKNRKHEIKGKTCEAKRAVSRENKKVFVGGISNDLPEEELRDYFGKYGDVDEIELPVDKATNRRRNFAFIVFKDEGSADKAIAQQKHLLGDRYCDVKLFQSDARKPRTSHFASSGNYTPPYGGYGGASGPSQAGYDVGYNQYWQQYWQYYYGQYCNQYGQQSSGPTGGSYHGGSPGGAMQQSGADWSQYTYDYPGGPRHD